MKKGAIVLAVLALLSKIIGFVKEAVIAYYFGTSYIVDAYTMADSIVVLLSGWIVALATVYIPIYIQIRKDKGQEEADRFTNSLINISLAISVVFMIIVVVLRKQIAYLFASSATADMRHWLEFFLVTAMISTLAIVIYRIVRANMDSRGRYIIGGLVDTFISIAMLCVVFLAGVIHTELLAMSTIIGYGVAAFICLFFLFKSGHKINILEKFHPAVKSAFSSAVPILLNIVIVDVVSMTDKVFGATLSEGTIAMLTYASMLESAVFQIVGTPILTVVYAPMAESILEKDKQPFRSIYERAMNSIFILFVPITVAVILLSSNIISVIYQRGNFDSNATYYTSILLRIYICGAAIAVVSGLTSRFLIAVNFSKTVLFAGIFSAMLNIVLNAMFIGPLGANGLALASVISTSVSIPVYLLKSREWINKDVYKHICATVIKCVIAVFVMSIYVITIKTIVGEIEADIMAKSLYIIVISAVGGAPLYFSMLYLMRVDEVRSGLTKLKERMSSMGGRE